MDKTRLIQHFSRSASVYDAHADVQRMCAVELAARLVRKDAGPFTRILELGCGTGNYCSLLSEKFSQARLTAVDISTEMIRVARGKTKKSKVDFIVADAEEIVFGENFDLITSNACFQWFEDLERALARYEEMLRARGMIAFCMFGPQTFRELAVSIEDVFQKSYVSAARFISKEKIVSLLEDRFAGVRVEEKFHQETFGSLGLLLKKIKGTGAIGHGFGPRIFFGPGHLRRLEAVYRERFGAIKATYQIFYCRGEKA